MVEKGFTLVELMVIILIVSILAAIAIPIMRGRVDAAKWSDGKAMMGTITTAIRAYVAELDDGAKELDHLSLEDIKIDKSFFNGRAFSADNLEIRDVSITDSGVPQVKYNIIIDDRNLYPFKLIIDESGDFSKPSPSTPFWTVMTWCIPIFIAVCVAFYIFKLGNMMKPIAQLETELEHLKADVTKLKEKA